MRIKPGWLNSVFLKANLFPAIVGAGVTALILERLRETLADPDLWGYLSFGRLFWNRPDFPYGDSFAYSPVKALWVYHEWLTGVIFYPLYSYLGAVGLQGLKYLIAGITAWLIYKTAREKGASAEASIFCLLLISPLFSFAYSPVRAQVFTNLFFVLTLYLLEKSRQSGKMLILWWLVPTFLIWANLHGGFVAGLGLIILFAAGELFTRRKAQPYLLILVPAILITIINPYGLQYWIYMIKALLMPRPAIEEWYSVFLAIQNGIFSTNILIYVVLLILAFLMLLKSRSRHLSDIFILSITALFAFQHVRHQSLFFLAMGCLAPFYFTQIRKETKFFVPQTASWKKAGRYLMLIFFAGLLIVYGLRFLTGNPFDLSVQNVSPTQVSDYNYPAGAVEHIRHSRLKGNILTEFSWGEYLIWSLPEFRIAMDGRYETVYPESTAREYFAFAAGKPGWQNYLNRYPHDMALFRKESIASALIRSMPDWQEVYSDVDCVLFTRISRTNIETHD